MKEMGGRMIARMLLALACVLPGGVAAGETSPRDEAGGRANWITFGAVGAVAAYGAAAWWSGDLDDNFRIGREGWFARDSYAGGADKLGHAYSVYLGTRVLAGAYRAAGLQGASALDRAVGVSLVTLMGVEILDGFSRQYRFSPEDAVMNLSGAAFAWALERHPDLDRVVDWRLLYRRSPEARARGIRDPIADYSGQTYLLVAKASGSDRLAASPWTRYLEVAVGYGTRGYRPERADGERSRHLYLGLGLNLGELFDAAFPDPGAQSLPRRLTHGVLEYVQVPGAMALDDRAW